MSLVIGPPTVDDASAWFDFIVAQQVITYDGVVAPDFAAQHEGFREGWVADLAREFHTPGTDRRLIARFGEEIVGVVSVIDGGLDWEVEMGAVPTPAPRMLERLYVRGDQQGTGLGTRLWNSIGEDGDVYLWLVNANTSAQAYYRRRGFVDLAETFIGHDSWGNAPMHRMVRRVGRSGATARA